MADFNYDYSSAEAYAKSLGLVFLKDWAVDFDQQAKAFGFTQAQVDMACQHHLIHLSHVLNPKIYTWKQRLGLAAHYIFNTRLK